MTAKPLYAQTSTRSFSIARKPATIKLTPKQRNKLAHAQALIHDHACEKSPHSPSTIIPVDRQTALVQRVVAHVQIEVLGRRFALVEPLATLQFVGFMGHGRRRRKVGLAPVLVQSHARGDLFQLLKLVVQKNSSK